LPDDERADAITAEFLQLAEAMLEGRVQLRCDGQRIVGQRQPDQTFPDIEVDGVETQAITVE
jgi:hypothetical protein